MVSGATLGKEFISDVSFRNPHMAYLANWPPLAILNNRCMRRGGGGGGHCASLQNCVNVSHSCKIVKL